MAVLYLKVLGGFEARLPSGDSVEIPIRKGRALLAYLALNHGQAVERTKLADLMWGDRGETQAQNSLRQTLTVLRKALSPMQEEVLRADRQSVGLDREFLEVDAVTFRNLVASGTPDDLEAAVALYRGDLLDGLEVSGPGFEDWLEDERRSLKDLMAGALGALIEHKRAGGARQEAVSLGQSLLTLDPLQESVHRTLMALHGELGQRQSALQQYQRCREILESELGVAPDPETVALYQNLRDTDLADDDAAEVPDEAVVTHWETDNGDAAPAPLAITSVPQGQGPGRWAVAAGLVLVIGGVAALGWLQLGDHSPEPASPDSVAFSLPDIPAIAALPIDNLSDRPPQEFIVGDITGDLLRERPQLDDILDFGRSDFEFQAEQTPVSAEQQTALNKPEAVAEAEKPAEASNELITVTPPPAEPSADRQIVSRPPADKLTRATPDDDRLLYDWRLRSDIVRKAIRKEYQDTAKAQWLISKFKIVSAAANEKDPKLVTLATEYTIELEENRGSGSIGTLGLEKTYRRSVVVDRRSAAVLTVGKAVASVDAPARPQPGQIPAGDNQLAARTPEIPARTAPNDGGLLSFWRLRPDIARQAIAKSRLELRHANAVFDKFNIVEATPDRSNNQLVELKTEYTLLNMGVSTSYYTPEYAQVVIDETIVYQQTVIVDRRSAAVLKVGEAVASSDVPKRPPPGQKSVGDNQLAAHTSQTPARTVPDDGRLLGHWRLRSNIVRKAIAKSRPDLSKGDTALDEFEIVRATPSKINNQLVELDTVYTLNHPYGHSMPGTRELTIDVTAIYHQTVVVDKRSEQVLKVGEVVAGSDVPERLRPGQKSLGDGQLAARTPQTPNRTEPDDGRLLSDWQLGSDIVREAIAKSRPLVREAQAVLGEFEIVEATPVNSNKRLVELKTVYKLEATASSFSGQKYGHDLIDETIIYQQTVIIDRLSATVVEVGDAVAGGGNKWAQPQQKNSVDDETLLAGKPETPAWTALDGG